MRPIIILAVGISLSACVKPCEDETCVANRMMILGIMAQHPAIEPYQIQPFIPSPPPEDYGSEISDLQMQLNRLKAGY